ncbi:hypothetical protein K1719_039826 [Acacia pycnantha]|nr:hypothetical protein K1719_039826 [Acacia pycnantha]
MGSGLDDNDTDMDDRIEDIIRDVEKRLLSDHMHMARHGWSDKSFSELLEALKDMLPDDNVLPHRYYDAKKILCPLGMEYKKIHACPNDCVLYRKEFEEKQSCPICETPLQVDKGPAKVLWYLPIIPRFKRLFANENDAKI